MKKIFLLTVMQVLVAVTASADANAISQWEDTIPLTADAAIEMISAEAQALQYRDSDSGIVCGGETANYELADYYTSETFEGVVTHSLFVSFQVTVPVDYCASEIVRVCQAKLDAVSADEARLAGWQCETLQ